MKKKSCFFFYQESKTVTRIQILDRLITEKKMFFFSFATKKKKLHFMDVLFVSKEGTKKMP